MGRKHSYRRWGICPRCYRERQVNTANLMVLHNRWQNGYRDDPGYMVLCSGTGSPPITMTQTGKTQNAK